MILLDNFRYLRGSPRTAVQWQRMLLSVKTRMDLSKERFARSALPTIKPLLFVKSLIDRITGPYLLEDRDLFSIYNESIINEAYTISKIFDPMNMGSDYREWMVRGSSTEEIFVPTYGIIRPAGGVWVDAGWDVWSKVKAVSILDHDSSELNLDFVDAYPTFKKEQPTYIVVGIDVAALFVQYIKYVKATTPDAKTFEYVNKERFIHEFVLPHIYDDLVTIWITKLISKAVTLKVDSANIDDLAVYNSNEYMGVSTLKAGIAELVDLAQRLSNNSIRMHDFVATNFYLDGRTMVDVMNDHNIDRMTEQTNRWRGYDIVKSLSLLESITNAMLVQDKYLNQNVLRLAKQEFDSLNRSNWKTHIKSTTIHRAVDTYLIDLAALLG